MGGVERGENSGCIQNCAHVGTEGSAADQRGITELIHQVAGGPVGQLRDQRLGVGVIKDQAVGLLREAGGLLVGGLVKALLVDFEAQGAGQVLGTLFEQFGIGQRCGLDLGQVGIKAHAVKTGGLQVLGGAHKGAGAPADSSAQGVEIAARFGGKKNERLLCFGGNRDKNTFVAHLLVPGFDARKPLGRGRVGGSAQEGNNEYEMS